MGWVYNSDREVKECYSVLVEKSLQKQPLGRPRKMCKDNLAFEVRETLYLTRGGHSRLLRFLGITHSSFK